MKCPQCNNSKFKTANVRSSVEVKGESFDVIAEINQCDECGFTSANDDQMKALQRKVADAYRVNHGLLTSDEIRSLRTDVGMSQVDFSNYLGVGESSVARWETFQIQDKSMDNLIRRSVVRAGDEFAWVV